MKKYELMPADGTKSFYKKAIVRIYSNGLIVLKSYETDVAAINENGDFVRLWGGYSATTQRHINAFCECFNIAHGGKAWWLSLDVGHVDLVNADLIEWARNNAKKAS